MPLSIFLGDDEDRFEPSDAHLSLRAKLKIWASNLARDSEQRHEAAHVEAQPDTEED
jgi:hypothetical protein